MKDIVLHSSDRSRKYVKFIGFNPGTRGEIVAIIYCNAVSLQRHPATVKGIPDWIHSANVPTKNHPFEKAEDQSSEEALDKRGHEKYVQKKARQETTSGINKGLNGTWKINDVNSAMKNGSGNRIRISMRGVDR